MPEPQKNDQEDGSNPYREESPSTSDSPSPKTHRSHSALNTIHLVIALCVPLWTINIEASEANPTAQRPNIIFILADDLGWSELGCYGNTFNETPHLDGLATEGVRFTQAYAAAPVCSPYRAALLTGQYPARIGISDYLRPNSANALSTEHTTLAEALRDSGYTTGMIGKWHLTGYSSHKTEFEIPPRDHGFTWDFARELKGVSNGVNFWPYLDRKQKKRWLDIPHNELGSKEFLVDRMNHEAVRFIERNKSRPFFLYLTHYATHSIVHGKPELVEKYRDKQTPGKSSKTRCVICSGNGLEGCPKDHWATNHNPHLAAMLESIDDGVGMITQTLDELELSENTIIVFTSDNGGETNVTANAPLRGGKSQLYEGGIRVPMIACWPKQIPPSTVSDHPTMNIDFYPTLIAAAGVTPPTSQILDGQSQLALWRNPKSTAQRPSLFWHYPLDQPHFLGGVSAAAIREGDWKLIEFLNDKRFELYSLKSDPSETRNLAMQYPKVTQALHQKLVSWQRDVNARSPSPPLLSEARQLYQGDHFSSGQISKRWTHYGAWRLRDGQLVVDESSQQAEPAQLSIPAFKNTIIRFDFKLPKSGQLRLTLGSEQHDHTVLNIHGNRFYFETQDKASLKGCLLYTSPSPRD